MDCGHTGRSFCSPRTRVRKTFRERVRLMRTESGKSRPDVARFRARVEAILGQGNAEKLNWGIEVADRDTGETLYELNADHFFTPASNAKIVTTALALATLGGDYRFHTTLESKSAAGQRWPPRRRPDSCRARRPRSFESPIPICRQRRSRRRDRKGSGRDGG